MSSSMAPALRNPPLTATPERVTLAFAAALNAGDTDLAASFFTRDACFLTPDATAIRGREEIRDVLIQLIGSDSQIDVEGQSMIIAGEIALSAQHWTMRSGGGEAPFAQTSRSTVLLRHLERAWKLLIVAPWGLDADARDRFVPAPLTV